MKAFEKVGTVILILLVLIIITPKISSVASKSIRTIGRYSFNDFILIAITIIALIAIFLVFLMKTRSSSAPSKRFRKLYKPKSDLQRVREYVKERLEAKESKPRIRHKLLKVGWDENTINTAFETANKAKLIKIRPRKRRRRKIKK